MLDGFGQAPVCIELDLDSYDGPWTHVERFRGRSGWLAVAEARLSGPDDEWTTTVIAACDDRGEVFPTWQAEHLLACACSRPTACDEYPPLDLDELLDEAAGELATRWVRENSRALRTLAASTTEHIAALEAATRAAVDEADRRDALLRRRRRMTSPGSDAWLALSEAMTAVGLDREAALHTLSERRAAARRDMAAADDAALHDANVSVEWELLYQVSWSAAGRVDEDDLVAHSRRMAGQQVVSSGGMRPPLSRHYGEAVRQAQAAAERAKVAARAQAERAAARAAVQANAPPAGSAGPNIVVGPASTATSTRVSRAALTLLRSQVSELFRRTKLERRWTAEVARKHRLRLAGRRRDVQVMSEHSGATPADRVSLAEITTTLDAVEAIMSKAGVLSAPSTDRTAAPSPAPIRIFSADPSATAPVTVPVPTPAAATAFAPPTTSPSAPSPATVTPAGDTPVVTLPPPQQITPAAGGGKLKLERDTLARQLVELETTGRKYLRGSPKFERNRAQRAELETRIWALNLRITGQDDTTIAAPSLEEQRAELRAELRRHEQRGAKPSDGVNPFGQYRDRRLSLLGRIAELDARIARQARREGHA